MTQKRDVTEQRIGGKFVLAPIKHLSDVSFAVLTYKLIAWYEGYVNKSVGYML